MHSAPQPNDVVITGVGLISSLGQTLASFWRSLSQGLSGVRRIQAFDPSSLPVQIAGEVDAFDPVRYVKPRKALKVMARDIQLGFAAAVLAREDSGLTGTQVDPERLGTVMATNLSLDSGPDNRMLYEACLDEQRRFHFDRWGHVMQGACFPLFMLKYLPNMAACHVGIAQDARGPNNSIVLGEAGGNLAVLEAVRVIQRGWADVMLAGGTSALIFPLRMVQLCLTEPLSRANDDPAGAMRPFDRGHAGYVQGEGACVFVLERRDHAEARGACVWARVAGGASGYQGPQPAQREAALTNTLRRTLDDAGWTPQDVGHVNADGWSLQECDAIESTAIRRVLGGVPVWAGKSYLGSCGAAAGPLELTGSLLAMAAGRLPQTLNYTDPDPACPVQVIGAGGLDGPATQSTLCVNTSRMGQVACLAIAAEAGRRGSVVTDAADG